MEIGCLEKCLARLFPFCRHLEEREVTLVGLSRTISMMSPKADMTTWKLDCKKKRIIKCKKAAVFI